MRPLPRDLVATQICVVSRSTDKESEWFGSVLVIAPSRGRLSESGLPPATLHSSKWADISENPLPL